MSYRWDLIRSQVRQFRTNLQSIYPIQILTIIKDYYFDNKNNILYFISNKSNSPELAPTRHLQLHQVNLNTCKVFHYSFYSCCLFFF
jgi:hypothetical protein